MLSLVPGCLCFPFRTPIYVSSQSAGTPYVVVSHRAHTDLHSNFAAFLIVPIVLIVLTVCCLETL